MLSESVRQFHMQIMMQVIDYNILLNILSVIRTQVFIITLLMNQLAI